jgi:hypothetical protein
MVKVLLVDVYSKAVWFMTCPTPGGAPIQT